MTTRNSPVSNHRSVLFIAISALMMAFLMTSWASAYEKKGTVYTTDGSQKDVKAAIGNALPGDTVMIPPGTFTYGAKGDVVWIPKPITLAGSGRDKTTIVIADTSGRYTNGAIRLYAAATIKDLTVKGAQTKVRTPFTAGKAKGWRITNVEFVQTEGKGSYFLYVHGGFGLVDNCTINGAAGNNELIFTRGPHDAWQTDDTIGTADNVYIEDCIFNNRGYVCDINSNGKAVVRFCTINGDMKVDGHGKASNTPPRGVRHMEVYHNSWTKKRMGWLTVEMRGGTGHLFNNTAVHGNFMLREYALHSKWGNFPRKMTLKDYPIDDQIGVGKDPKKGGSAPMYIWNNRMASGAAWKRSVRKLGEFTEADVIAPDRDFFREVKDFDGSSGMGIGTREQMDAIKPTREKVGFWVTDEGEWNAKNEGPDGRLYVWDGKAWKLKYTPYPYPHPLTDKDAAFTYVHPQGGVFLGSKKVILICNAEGATIHYTLDGSAPTPASPVYKQPLTLSKSATVRAFAVRKGKKNSAEAKGVFRKVEGVEAVSASATDHGNRPLKTLDGNLKSRWSAEGKDQWIQYDLGSVKTVASVDIAWHRGNKRRFTFDVLISKDGKDWTTVLEKSVSSGKSVELEKHDLKGVAARYVKYVGQGNSSNEWNSVTEFKINTKE